MKKKVLFVAAFVGVAVSASFLAYATQTVPLYGQCGGIGYPGPTTCVAGTTCTIVSEFYSQCL